MWMGDSRLRFLCTGGFWANGRVRITKGSAGFPDWCMVGRGKGFERKGSSMEGRLESGSNVPLHSALEV